MGGCLFDAFESLCTVVHQLAHPPCTIPCYAGAAVQQQPDLRRSLVSGMWSEDRTLPFRLLA